MTIEKGKTWGRAAPLPADAPIATSDSEARRHAMAGALVIGLTGGDLWRSLGAPRARDLRGPDAMTFEIDLGEAILDSGEPAVFVSSLVARTRLWTRAFVAMNGDFAGRWLLGPRAHPNDGLLDCSDARLSLAEVLKVGARAGTGAHLPHPGISTVRAARAEADLGRPVGVWLDGERAGRARHVAVRALPDAISVVV